MSSELIERLREVLEHITPPPESMDYAGRDILMCGPTGANTEISMDDFQDIIATITQLQAELAEAREDSAKLRADLNRCFKGETHSVRNERVLAKIETYTAAAIEARDWSKP